MKKFFTHLSVAVLLMFSATSLAQTTLEAGKVYNFKSVGYSGKSMAAEGLNKTVIDDTALDDYTQLWYVAEGTVSGTYTLRNLGNGCYLQGAGSGTKWPFVEQPSNLYYQAAGTGFSLTADSGQNPTHQYWMHYGAGNGCVVGWDANAGASQWTVEEVAISAQDLQANWEEVELLNGASEKLAVYQTYLDNLFFDKSCTTPKKLLSTVSDIESDVDYRALPAGLQAMVKKVYLGEWSEKNIISEKLSWSSEHAKRFRVQLYEPYSYGERTNSMLGIYAHSNMNNPTGLVANQRNLLYVMVEGEIKEGARLYLQSLVGDDRIGDIGGVELTEGLNIIPYWSDGNQLFIQYVVNTYENGAKTGHKLSQYEPLKIHIQGGCINGCFDTVGDALNPADTDEDWDAYEVRAHQYNFTVLGKYVMWHMPLVIDDDDAGYYDLSECLGTNATSVKTAMGAWETIESAQRLMEGLLSEQEVNTIPNASRVFEYTGNDSDELYPSDYSEEYNNRSMAYSTKDGYFMFAADWSTHYASNTLDDVILNIATAGDPWGPSHEIGHTYQGPINLPSTSETSNNAIANVSNWFLGRTSSRLGSTQSLLAQYNNNTSFLGTDINSGNVWEKLMMYTKLWFYYHVTGHNKKFYPRLFEMLRRDPIARNKGVALSGNETMLKFYKYACMAAGEDLTDFFEVFGFFVPVDGTLSDDYGDFKTVMTQAEIDAAKAEVAAMAAEKGWKKNTAIIFIDDRIGTVYSHDGQTVLQPRGDGGKEQGVLGSINDFDSNPNNDVAPLSGEYSYTISGNTITMQGATGGVGFIIYDADGNLVSFSNTYSFPLGEKAQAALASGTARVVVTTADIDAKPIEIHDANATQTQAELLEGLLEEVAELLSKEDESGTKVGYYKSSALAALEKAYTAASEVYNNKDIASYGGVYSVLYEEYNAVKTSPVAKIEFVDGRTYYLKNVESGCYMTVVGNNVMATTTVPTATSTASLWQINAGFYESFYSIKNQSTDTYIRQPQKENNDYVNSQQFVLTSSSQEFMFEEVSTGKFAIKDRGSKKYLNYHASGSKIATWGANNVGSQWEIVYLPTDETMAQRTALEDLVLSTQLLIDEVGFAEYEELELQKDPSKANYLYCNAPHGSDDGDGIDGEYVKNLTDGKTSSYLHTNWDARSTENHYLRVDLGVGNELETIKFAYATRSSTNLDMPSKMLVQGSNSETTGYTTLATLTKDDAVNPLPTAGSTISWYKSSEIASATPYRFYRFVVTETKRGLKDKNNYYVFTMSEFRMYKKTTWLNSEYNTQDNLDLLNAAFEKMVQAEEIVSSSAATEAELETAYNNLSGAYKQLLDAKTAVDNSALNAEKERLQALVNSATSLINECKVGDIVSSPAAEVAVVMQATDPSAANYLYCNALNNKSAGNNNGDNCMNTAKLLDNNTETYLHTIPDGQDPEDNLDHYLRVDFGDGAEIGMLKFAYHTRKVSSYKVFPETIKIEGSNNLKEGFEEIKIISSGLPSEANEYYESAVIGNGKSYRYIRFMVTDTYADRTTSDNAVYGQHKYFCLAEFDLWTATVDQLKVTLSGNCGRATETMVLDAYRAVQAAQKSLEMATTAEQLQTAYSVLDAAYTVLDKAKNAVNKSELDNALQQAKALLGNVTTDGIVNNYYSGSETVILAIDELNNAVTAAQEIFDAAQTTQNDVDAAKRNLETTMVALQEELDKDVTVENRTTLNNLLAQTTELVNTVAVVSLEDAVIPLQCDNEGGDYFIWTNAQQPGDANHIRNLLDANPGTMFHSSWGNGAETVDEKHYLAIDLGKSSIKEFEFNYTTYATGWSYCPTDITVQGSNDFVEFTDIKNLTKDDSEKPLLNTNTSEDYTSMILNADGKYYRYLRFVVNSNQYNGKFNEQYYFQLATFGLTSKGESITINESYLLTNVTADMVSAVYGEVAATTEIAGKYMTQEQYNSAYNSLLLAYTTLENAKKINKTVLEQALAAAIVQRETLINTEGDLDEYWTTSTAFVLAFEELNGEIEAAQRVFNSKTATQQEIDAAATALNDATTRLREIVNLDYTDNDTVSRDELRNLIAESELLLEQVATGEVAQFVQQELITALETQKTAAANVVERYMTEGDYSTMLQVLRQEYEALNAALFIAKSKVELKRLADATTLLKNSLYEISVVSYNATEVTLQCERDGEEGYLYCNAPETNSQWTNDNKGVAGCIDLTDGNPNLSTFLHTEYGNDQSADGLDHYLRVDLGEGGAAYVEFGYVGRSGHESKSPETVVVAATNELNGEWTTIANLTMAQPNATTETKTGALGNGVAYRYWRFMVTDTYFNGQSNGHPYFALSDFNVYTCDNVVLGSSLKSKYTPNIYIYTTTELAADVEAAITAATAVYNNPNATMDDCDNAIAALQPVYDELAQAIELYWCPVVLTTDVAHPALYTIDAVRRGNGKAWQYNAQNNNITVVDKNVANLYHLWYFVQGAEEHTVKIVPVMTPGYELTANSADDFGNGANKVSAVAENSVNWSFAFVNNYWNFKPAGKNTYLSHYGGGSNALGFYGNADDGSYVSFTAVEVNDYAKARLAKLAEGKSAVEVGTALGTYTEASAGGYNDALESANELLANANSTPQEYVDAFTLLFNASNVLVINMPDPAKFYVLRCNHESRYIYVNGENKLQWAASSYDKALSNAVWMFDDIDVSAGTCKLKSLHTQSYLSGLSGSQWAFGETGKVVTLAKSPSVDGAVIFKIDGNGNNGLHAHGNNNTVISHTNDAGANHYFLEEVEVVTTIKHTVTMNATFSSVMLGYNATVPEGVEAYNAEGVEDGEVSLVKIDGDVIPANTPVILYRTDDKTSKTFTYTTAAADVPKETVLGGSLYLKYVECEDDKDYYKLMIKGGVAKMYWMYKEFNAAGVSQGETNDGGHIKCSANKIYMALPKAQAAASFGMRFIDGGATGLDGTFGENGKPETIYDLTGRKVVDAVAKGVYIINGKKTFVK